jgi:DMSO/TMAO reductase YedYZ heme-binding membrane subunit
VRFRQTINLLLSAAWFAEVPWPLRIVRGILVLLLFFAVMVAVAWLGFGRDAEREVIDVGEGLTEIALIIFVPVLLFGLIVVPFHRWLMKKTMGATYDSDHFQS